jgi:putative endonuclease
MDRARTGRTAEDVAAEFLRREGLELLHRNYRRRGGELDLVARSGDVLVIAEVRTRSTEAFGGAAASVDGWKQHKIIRAATLLLQQHKALAQLRVRFDVIVVHEPESEQPRVEWIRHAFDIRATI